MTIGEAIKLYVLAHRRLVEAGITDFVGTYGEYLAQHAIGGNLMPPVYEAYDLEHPHYGRVQIKARALLDRVGGVRSTETRAVLKQNRDFDWLLHIVFDRDMVVRDAVLAPLSSLKQVVDRNSGKVSIQQTRAALGSLDITNQLRAAQLTLNQS